MNAPTADPLVALRHAQHQELALLVPALHPFGTDERQMLTEGFARWLRLGNNRAAVYGLDWRRALDQCTGARAHRPGSLSVVRTRCPDCRGRRIGTRHGLLQPCLRCQASGRVHETVVVAVLRAAAPAPDTQEGT